MVVKAQRRSCPIDMIDRQLKVGLYTPYLPTPHHQTPYSVIRTGSLPSDLDLKEVR